MRSSLFISLIAVLFLASCGTSDTKNQGTTTVPSLENGRINLGDRGVSFIPPPNLQQLTKEQIANSKFGGAKPADYVFANESQTATVGVVFNFVELAPDQLEDYIDANGRLLSMAIPEVQFLANEMVTINGRSWVHFELISEAPAANLHNHQYTTSFNGGALVFSFNSTLNEYGQYKDEFLKSAQSILIKD